MKIIPKNDNKQEIRYIIVDDNENIIDDAQGYGYKTKQNAYKAMNYKFKGGKQKKIQQETEKRKFFKKYPGLKENIQDIYEINFKEISKGEVTEEDIKKEIDKKYNIDIPLKWIKY